MGLNDEEYFGGEEKVIFAEVKFKKLCLTNL